MKSSWQAVSCILLTTAVTNTAAFAQSQPKIAAASGTKESTANTLEIPKQILKTGVSLDTRSVAPNSLQLANTIELSPILESINTLRSGVGKTDGSTTIEGLSRRQDLWD
ncbi:MAG: hypothetical protein IAF58_18950, partial [Leptolyngbya sp.]|nr:hypothetical protein [Candidatus Melainabacteria bacterium]